MDRTAFIASRTREVLLDGTWIANTNFQDQITKLDWKQATHRIANLNTVALLVFHIDYYLDGILRAFRTGKLDISDKFSFDMPEISSEEDWQKLVRKFLSDANGFADYVEAMDESELDKPFIDAKYDSNIRNLEGVIEHSYYHLGQVVLIAKMVTESDSKKG